MSEEFREKCKLCKHSRLQHSFTSLICLWDGCRCPHFAFLKQEECDGRVGC